ncbi:DUF4199 family protein [Aquimarina sp. AU474]|uniref:DUF4199 family protein n=1 Tax=Aquimarina sp. AU474 TaxID=2108529 RepID=UPI000D6907DE|nr:DUF4199 family protein [Aquimarina sp. AU474]
MKETTVSIKKHIIKYGVILGIISVPYMVKGIYTDYNWHHYSPAGRRVSSLLELLFYISFISFAIYRFKKINNNVIILKQALMIGVGSMLVGFFINNISRIILYTIDSNRLNRFIGFPEDVSTLSEKSHFERVFCKFAELFLTELIFYFILGLIISLISGAIMHKRSL